MKLEPLKLEDAENGDIRIQYRCLDYPQLEPHVVQIQKAVMDQQPAGPRRLAEAHFKWQVSRMSEKERKTRAR